MMCLVSSGCGDSGPQRHLLSGRIFFDGNPVQAGWIVFSPEQGPGATANIENGKYETPVGFGTVGGMHTVEVVAFDGIATPDSNAQGGMKLGGKLLFSYTFKQDIPKESTTWDIEISRDDIEQNSQ